MVIHLVTTQIVKKKFNLLKIILMDSVIIENFPDVNFCFAFSTV